ncbi:MAG TPA: transposase [Pyrinomonadaceae bacterium]|nr:transposase [Pyrinomonadaceae bacterium]
MNGTKVAVEPLTCVYPNAAGLDIGAREIWASVPADRDPEPVRCFGTFTPDLQRLVACRIDTVAMESTGVYWIPVFELLEAAGLDARLVEPRQLKRVPGRKSDYLDCQWTQKLHSLARSG